MVDGCGFPEGNPLRAYWVFYGALSNVAFELSVRDSLTGELVVYQNDLDTFASRKSTR